MLDAYMHDDKASGDTNFDEEFTELRIEFAMITRWKCKNQKLPVAVNEYGLKPSRPCSPLFLKTEIDLLETEGLNHAIWLWDDKSGDCYDPEIDVFFDREKDPLSLFSEELRIAWKKY
ncbi:MAG: hypothetical protein SGI77_10580 [Pirellulaceae bacterium]|nr:hypothetical protein [Pirellulaceae bacterium]